MPRGVEHDWSDHIRGVLVELQNDGAVLRGADLSITTDLPVGAGLSSSGYPIDRVELARVAQRAENVHAGTKSGIMDQFISANARAAEALLLDTRDLSFTYIPLPVMAMFVVCNTIVKHSHASGGYNARRAECEVGVTLLAECFPGIRSLRDVTLDQLSAARGAPSNPVFGAAGM